MPKDSTNLVFPAQIISSLRDVRGERWKKFVDKISLEPEDSPDCLAFILMMSRLNNCVTCNSDSFHATQGCLVCSQQSLRRYRGTDSELIALHKRAIDEVNSHLQEQ
jgi:hypothetical protein